MYTYLLFVPLILFINSLISYTLNKWLSVQGLFLISLFTVVVTLLLTSSLLYTHFLTNTYWFVDLGRLIHIYNYLDMHFILLYDNLSLIMTLVVTALTGFTLYFGLEYMYREAFIARLLYLLNAFSTSVIFLFFVYDFILLLIVWELIGLFSLLLVNFYSIRIYTVKAALKTFFFSRLSDFFLFSAFIIFIFIFGSGDFSLIFIQSPFMMFYSILIYSYYINMLNFISLLLVIAASIKAAQFLFYVWLPDAMEAPTPASALIHSSTLVIMGIFVIIRFQVIFEFSYLGNYMLIILGGVTISSGAISASFQNDIKKLVAYSTISQMGYLFCGCGFISHGEVLFYLVVHAINKAFLFIIVGYTVHFFGGNTDMRFMGGLWGFNKFLTSMLFFISLNLTGLPLTSGFISKEFLIFQTFKFNLFYSTIRVFWLISFIFTPFYMIFLNTSVSYYSKYIKLSNLISYPLKLKYLKYHNVGYLNSGLLISKTSFFVYTIFFILINFIDSFFNNYNLINLNLIFPYESYSPELANYNLILTKTAVTTLNTLIPVLTFITIRYIQVLHIKQY